MNTLSRTLTVATVVAVGLGLAACNSGTDEAPQHDHSAHESGAAMQNEHAGHQAGGMKDAAMDMQPAAGATVTMKEIAPSADYPLTTCVVSDEDLGGDMGDAIAFEVDGQEVQFCCAGCVDEFKESPEKFLAKVRDAQTR